MPISTRAARHARRRRSSTRPGELLPADAYVFGDEIGRRRRVDQDGLAADAVAARRSTDLHFHDLRREAGLALDGCRHAAGDDSTLARAREHRADLDVSRRVARRRRAATCARYEARIGRLPP